jgi:hypothetical protein
LLRLQIEKQPRGVVLAILRPLAHAFDDILKQFGMDEI